MLNSRNLLSKYLIIISLLLNTSCVHTKKYEEKQVDLKKDNSAFSRTLEYKNLDINNIVYLKTEYPLSDFFDKLLDGEFNESIKQIKLDFKPTNTSNEIMQALLNEGIIPAYVSIKNTSDQEVQISYKQFYLTDNDDSHFAFNPDYLPSRIKQHSSEAVVANIYNFTVAVTVTFLIFLAFAPILNGYNGEGIKGDSIYNDTKKTTHIDYRDYLISQKTLKPGEQIYGLLFFNLKNIRSPHDFHLEYKESIK